MPKIDDYEREELDVFEKDQLKSVASKAELGKFKVAARATAIKDRRVNIRLSSGDLSDIQTRLKKGCFSNADCECAPQIRDRPLVRDSGGRQALATPHNETSCDVGQLTIGTCFRQLKSL